MLASSFLVAQVSSKPMDAKAAEMLPAARRIAELTARREALTEEDVKFLAQCIASKDAVLASFAAWVYGSTEANDTQASDILKAVKSSELETMPKAFIQIALNKISARKSREKWVPTEIELESENPFVQLESARELLQLDAKAGEMACRKLTLNSSLLVKASAERFLVRRQPGSAKVSIPLPDERYDLLLSIIDLPIRSQQK